MSAAGGTCARRRDRDRAIHRGTGWRTSLGFGFHLLRVLHDLFTIGPLAQVIDDATPAFRLESLADVAAMQDEPVMCIKSEFPGRNLDQRILHSPRCFPDRDPSPVGH